MTTQQNATAQDFIAWTARARDMSIDSLIFAMNDCYDAAAAMATHPAPNREGYYLDQAMTFEMELKKKKEARGGRAISRGFLGLD